MNEPHDPNRTVAVPSTPADSLDAGLAAGFGRPVKTPRSSLDASHRPLLLKEADGESAHVVRPNSEAMPDKAEAGDRYQLFGEIARGGMGAVLRGRDADLGRDLAVKVLLEKHAGRPEVLRRFIEEAQIGGQLQHPGVVPVYDIGRFGERPFFTMKLVKGQTLAALLGERADPSTDRARFLAITLQVAQTLAYAHARGVIHRDLKPANIMVGAFGEVQVMDWGLAKVLAEGGIADEEKASRGRQSPQDGSLIRTARSSGSMGSFGTDTEAGSLLGTPAYMPPEQANGDVANLDRRADVFALGAILCEILTGSAPYLGRSAEEVRRKAANGDLVDALARLGSCGGDTELIALTRACLSPEAIDRPKDAQAVAEALATYLDGVQERLHQAELAEAQARAKALEEAQRRRLTVALAATVLLAVTLGGGGWLWIKTDREARQTRVAREVNEALNKATSLRERAKATPVGGAALFAQAREQAQRAQALVENGPADTMLTVQVRHLQVELDDEEKDRKLLDALERARVAKADLDETKHQFSFERAVPLFREAFREYGLPAGEGDPASAVTRILKRSAAVRETLVSILDEWIDLASGPNSRVREPHLGWLRAVAGGIEPAQGWIREFRIAQAENNLANRRARLEKLAREADVRKLPAHTLTRLGQRLMGVQAPTSALHLLRRAVKQYPADVWLNHDLGMVALTFPGQAELEDALRYLTAAVALRPDSAAIRLNQGNALIHLGRSDEGIACYRRVIHLDPNYASAHRNLGIVLKNREEIDEAVTCFRNAVKLDPSFTYAWGDLAIALGANKKFDEALACLKKALELDPNLAMTHTSFGIVYKQMGQFGRAITSLRKALDCDPNFVLTHYNLGNVHEQMGQFNRALSCYRRAIRIDSRYPLAYVGLGHVYLKTGRPEEALAVARKAIELNPTNPIAHTCLAFALEDTGKLDEAIATHRKAVEIAPKLANSHMNLGIALKIKGQFDEAIACHRKAIELDPKFALAHYNLGNALAASHRIDEAVASYKHAIELNPRYGDAYNGMGVALAESGRDLDAAIANFKKAIEIDPKNALAHCHLGHALRIQGRFAESLAAHQRGHELGSKQPDWPYPSAEWVRQAEEMAALETKLPAFLKGEFQPKDSKERLGLAGICQGKKLHHATAGLYADAFAADPKLADDLKAAHRYNAVCHAARAATGQGEDAAKLDDKERTRLRKQALDWLRADLALWTRQLESGKPADSAAVQQTLRHWHKDTDLAGLRDKVALAKLPAQEQKALTQMWADVAVLLKKAETPAPKERKR
jgi:serine/threonine-protein kinase